MGRQEAEDLVQSTLERALRHLDSFQPGGNLLAWLRRIMSNLIVDQWRQQKRRNRTCVLLEDAHHDPRLHLEAAGGEHPATPVWEGLSRQDVARAIPRLTARVRPVFELADQGLSYQEIAARLGLRTNTVGTRLLRARRQLRRLLLATRTPGHRSPANDNGAQGDVRAAQQ